MYIYHALINALSAHMIQYINLNTIFYTHVDHSPTKTIYIRYYLKHTHTKQKTKTYKNKTKNALQTHAHKCNLKENNSKLAEQ